MICKNPYIAPGGKAFGCGQCIPCRINKRRTWTHRLILEAADHDENSFVTLTYNDEHIPTGGTLHPADLSRFLKRFRKQISPHKIRYFGVGEYGDETQRPHYHLAIFGYPHCHKGVTSPRRDGYCCDICNRVLTDWGMGNIYSGQLTVESAAYIAGYVTKKLTNAGDERLDGRHPEFARMSLRPGIGAGASDEMADVLLKHRLDDAAHIPTRLAHGQSKLPIGRYLRDRLRERINVSKEDLQKFLDENQDPQVLALREAAFRNAPPGSKAFAYKQALIDHNQGSIIRAESRAKIHKKKVL